MTKYLFSFDVETMGLFGPAFAVACTIFSPDGKIVESKLFYCPPDKCNEDDLKWVKENVLIHMVGIEYNCKDIESLYNDFWDYWMLWKDKSMMIADVIHPVESSFITNCIKCDLEKRKWNGPYPFLDVSSMEHMVDKEKVESFEKSLYKEYPNHYVLADSIRCGLKYFFIKNKL